MTTLRLPATWAAAFSLAASCASENPSVVADVTTDTVESSTDTTSEQDILDTTEAEDAPEVLEPDSGVDDTSAGDAAETVESIPEIVWVTEGAIEVGVVSVPYDYAAPDGPRFDLRVGRVKRTGPVSKGVILFNFGGPGADGLRNLQFVSEVFSESLKFYDFVSWNPRGSFGSDQLGCTDDVTALEAVLDVYDGSLESSSLDVLLQTMRDFIDSCRLSNPLLIDHMGFVSWADDMESIRIALGVEQLSYFGISAGTALGAAYAQRYPERVDRFVLDSSVSPYGGLNTMLGWQAKGADTIVGEWATWCSETKNCAVHDDPMGSLEAATQQATTEPLDVNGTRLTYGRMSFGAFWNLYSEAGWPALAKDLAAASSGDGSGLLEAERAYNLHNDSGGVDPAVAIIYLTGCADSNWQPTAGDLAEATLAGEAASGSGGGLSRLLWVDNLWCTALGPVANAVPPLKGVDAPPILMLQSRFDVATPLPGALVLQSELDNGSPMVVWEGSIHGAAFSSNCMRDHADVFFTTGALPADGETCD